MFEILLVLRWSRAVVRLEPTEFVASLDRDGSLAGLEFKHDYIREAWAHTGDKFTALSWMPDGQRRTPTAGR